jgi:hypothetical protein
MARFTIALRSTIAIIVLSLSAADASLGDALSDLAHAVEKFRGIGHEGITSYRVDLRIPDEGEEESIPLEEIWQSPRDLVLRAATPETPTAMVRSLALYLEPLYVARTSLLDADLGAHVEHLRENTVVEAETTATGTRIVLQFPDDPEATLETFRDVARLAAEIDGQGRMRRLELALREEEDPLTLECEFDPAHERPQPDLAVWTLPSREQVQIRTMFRDEGGRSLPASRYVVFPSRYDPGEREEILVHYGAYVINAEIPADLLTDPGSFRYDVNGLVAN